ncbi:predicted protein [Sclerotinia sclerotiorum 1980 UF-70]|uniref:Uncharacterized protein n=1 Tax=Sclerotinia sclerotiorum (strain ATCC 18683 / 1980 / Ss-1) TaxID=665079 RepID=A7E588_SCLS1|nr:predicted protein [Sclerotinia sclerotiorum 1980 UF-70]EDN91060.1 predicted protein [Sclerotinia sclerotiorum 1980 UF-70]
MQINLCWLSQQPSDIDNHLWNIDPIQLSLVRIIIRCVLIRYILIRLTIAFIIINVVLRTILIFKLFKPLRVHPDTVLKLPFYTECDLDVREIYKLVVKDPDNLLNFILDSFVARIVFSCWEGEVEERREQRGRVWAPLRNNSSLDSSGTSLERIYIQRTKDGLFQDA